jgi:hypothetical protein
MIYALDFAFRGGIIGNAFYSTCHRLWGVFMGSPDH